MTVVDTTKIATVLRYVPDKSRTLQPCIQPLGHNQRTLKLSKYTGKQQSTNLDTGWTSWRDVFIGGVDDNDSCEDSSD